MGDPLHLIITFTCLHYVPGDKAGQKKGRTLKNERRSRPILEGYKEDSLEKVPSVTSKDGTTVVFDHERERTGQSAQVSYHLQN